METSPSGSHDVAKPTTEPPQDAAAESPGSLESAESLLASVASNDSRETIRTLLELQATMLAMKTRLQSPLPVKQRGPMDAVYIFRHSDDDDLELRYSLRSVAQHAPWLRKIWIYGDRPNWLADDRALIEHVPHEATAQPSHSARRSVTIFS